MNPPHSHCHRCGAAYLELVWPRRCASCGGETWRNATPVVVLLQPLVRGDDLGLLITQRNIEPGRGKWAFASGFQEIEDWRLALAREAREEVRIDIEASRIVPFDVRSTPDHALTLIFGMASAIAWNALDRFTATVEVSDIGFMTRDTVPFVDWAFPIHGQVAKRFFGLQPIHLMTS